MLVVVNGQCSSRQCGRGLETLSVLADYSKKIPWEHHRLYPIQIVQSGSTVCIDFKISVSFSLLRYRLFSNGIHQATVFMCLTWTHKNQSYSARAFTITEKPLCQRQVLARNSLYQKKKYMDKRKILSISDCSNTATSFLRTTGFFFGVPYNPQSKPRWDATSVRWWAMKNHTHFLRLTLINCFLHPCFDGLTRKAEAEFFFALLLAAMLAIARNFPSCLNQINWK